MRSAKRASSAPEGEGVITSLVAKRGRSDRIAVYLDGSRAFDLAATVADEANLRVGETLTADARERLTQRDAPYRARERALGLLALRDRSRREMETRLGMAGFEPEVVLDTVEWLEGLDYVDDVRFAAHYTAEKAKSGWGPQRIRAELSRKGVARTVVEEALRPEADSGLHVEAGLEAVIALARRRFGRQFADDPAAAERRLAGFLARRGHDWDAIQLVVRTLSLEAGESFEMGQALGYAPEGGGGEGADEDSGG
jgi:regulatory protein